MRNEELKPCPFCGSKRIIIYDRGSNKGKFAICTESKVSTNVADREEDAVYLWNKRAEELRSNCEVLRSKCQALPSMQWIPVSERLPEDEEIYLVRVILKNGRVNWNRAWYDGMTWHGSGMVPEVTHWMKINLEVEE